MPHEVRIGYIGVVDDDDDKSHQSNNHEEEIYTETDNVNHPNNQIAELDTLESLMMTTTSLIKATITRRRSTLKQITLITQIAMMTIHITSQRTTTTNRQ